MKQVADKQMKLLKVLLFNGKFGAFEKLAEKIKTEGNDPEGKTILTAILKESFGWFSFQSAGTSKDETEQNLYKRQEALLGVLGPQEQIGLLSFSPLFSSGEVDGRIVKLIKEIPATRGNLGKLRDGQSMLRKGLSPLAQTLLSNNDWAGFDLLCQKTHGELNLHTLAGAFYLFYQEEGLQGSFMVNKRGASMVGSPLYLACFLLAKDQQFLTEAMARGVSLSELQGAQDDIDRNGFVAAWATEDSTDRLDKQVAQARSLLAKFSLEKAIGPAENRNVPNARL